MKPPPVRRFRGAHPHLLRSIELLLFRQKFVRGTLDSDAPKQPLNRITFTETHQNIPYQIVKSPEVCFKNKMFNILDQKVYITDPVWTHLNVFDGEIGFQLIKRIGQKTLFDFDNMTIEKY